MREHREPPSGLAEGQRTRSAAPPAPDRLALPAPGPAPPRLSRLDRRRARRWVAVALGGLLTSGLIYAVARAVGSWLADQPTYQLPFRSIRLEPPPPRWYRGGAAAFLEDIRRRARRPETLPFLKLTAKELWLDFERSSPWTEKVRRIDYQPLGVTIELAYRRPVAMVEAETASRKAIYLVDRSAVLLPPQVVDLDLLRQESGLIMIKGEHLSDPLDRQFGLPWKPRPGISDLAPGNDLIPAAARLAAFLLEKMRSIDRAANPALDIRYINPMDPGCRGLFLWNAESTYILWGRDPGTKTNDEERWAKLCAWGRTERERRIPPGDFWEIGPSGVFHVAVKNRDRDASPPGMAARRDHAAIPARGPGQSGESLSHSR